MESFYNHSFSMIKTYQMRFLIKYIYKRARVLYNIETSKTYQHLRYIQKHEILTYYMYAQLVNCRNNIRSGQIRVHFAFHLYDSIYNIKRIALTRNGCMASFLGAFCIHYLNKYELEPA